jgi:hypothetical protein
MAPASEQPRQATRRARELEPQEMGRRRHHKPGGLDTLQGRSAHSGATRAPGPNRAAYPKSKERPHCQVLVSWILAWRQRLHAKFYCS